MSFSLQLDRNGRPVLTYGNRPKIDPSTVLNFDMDKLGKNPWISLERAPLTSKTAKFESDLLKTNEDIASQRREILQTLVYGGGQKNLPLTMQTSVHFHNFAKLYLGSCWPTRLRPFAPLAV